jgi:hypothetical protein
MRSRLVEDGKIIGGFDEYAFPYPHSSHTPILMINREKLLNWALTTLREGGWAPLSVFVIYRVAKGFGAYLAYPPLDIPTHFMGGVAIAYFYLSAIANAQKLVGNIPVPIQILFAFTCTGTTTVLWEFFEYVSDFFFHTNMILGLEDTLKDMFLGLLGGMILLLWLRAGRSQVVKANLD